MIRTPSPNWYLSRQATANFGLVLVVILFNCVVIHRNTVSLQTEQQTINQMHDVLIRTEAVFSSLCSAEAESRDYIMTGRDAFFQTYQQLAAAIPGQLASLRLVAVDNLLPSEQMDDVVRGIEERLSQLESLVELRKTQGTDAAVQQIATETGKAVLDRIRQDIVKLQDAEKILLNNLNQAHSHSLFVVLIANLMAMIVGVSITIVAWLLVERELHKRRLAEIAAELERQNLLVTLTSIADGVIVADQASRIILANPVAQELIGGGEDITGKKLKEIFSVVDEVSRQPVKDQFDQVLEDGRIISPLDCTYLLTVDGKEIPIEQTGAPIREASGKVTGGVFVFRDCSVRRQLGRETQERERFLRRVFETPLIGIAIGSAEGELLEANDAFMRLIGGTPHERGQGTPTWIGMPQAPLSDQVQRELQDTGACRPFEKTFHREDGTLIPALISAARLMDEKDRIVVFVTDLTQSKKAEAELVESNGRFRVLSECMPQKVWTTDAGGKLDYLNHMLVEYAGMSSDRSLDRGLVDLIHPEDRSDYEWLWNRSLASGNMFETEFRLRKHTGEYRWHLTRALPMYSTDSQITMWIGTDTDIHDQKRAEEELVDEHRRKDQFLALLAHELRNPLAPLSNAIQVFPSVRHNEEDAVTLLGIMQRQVRQMTRLIDDLLDLARINTGRMRLRREPVQVSTIFAVAVEAVQPLVDERKHRLRVTLPEEELWLNADPARLSQVLTNLLHNSVKYTEPGGQIGLTAERRDRKVVIRVSDNGTGISREMLTRVFDLFTQAEPTLDRSHGGLGIGLTLVRTLMELHDGTVMAFSEGVGLGSEFVIEIPLIEAPLSVSASTGDESQSVSPAVEAPLTKLRVLVVDDVQASAKTLALLLKSMGQNVEIAFDGPSAIERIKGNSYDLVFLDIAMPNMNGLEVARILRSKPELKSLTLVALTGFGQEEDRTLSREAGFDEHLIKPTSFERLREILMRVGIAKPGSN